MCKFKTGTNTDYNRKAGFNFISFYNKLYIYFLPWFVLHKNVVQCKTFILCQGLRSCDHFVAKIAFFSLTFIHNMLFLLHLYTSYRS